MWCLGVRGLCVDAEEKTQEHTERIRQSMGGGGKMEDKRDMCKRWKIFGEQGIKVEERKRVCLE